VKENWITNEQHLFDAAYLPSLKEYLASLSFSAEDKKCIQDFLDGKAGIKSIHINDFKKKSNIWWKPIN
jgi:hypothetical protein